MFKNIDSRTLLSGSAIAGVLAVGVSGYFAGMKAQRMIFEKESDDEELKKKDLWLIAGKSAWPTIVIGLATGGAIIGSHHIATKNIEAVTLAYTTTAAMLEAHQKTELAKLGTDVANEIKEEVGKEYRLPEMTELNTCHKHAKDMTDYLCFDDYSGRYFWSTADKIEGAFIKLSRLLFETTGNCASVNDLYDLLDMDEAGCGVGWGWDLEFDNEELKEYIHYETYPSQAPGGKPCLVLIYHPLQIVPF